MRQFFTTLRRNPAHARKFLAACAAWVAVLAGAAVDGFTVTEVGQVVGALVLGPVLVWLLPNDPPSGVGADA